MAEREAPGRRASSRGASGVGVPRGGFPLARYGHVAAGTVHGGARGRHGMRVWQGGRRRNRAHVFAVECGPRGALRFGGGTDRVDWRGPRVRARARMHALSRVQDTCQAQEDLGAGRTATGITFSAPET